MDSIDITTWYLTHSVDIPAWLTPQLLRIKPSHYVVLEMVLRSTYYGQAGISAETLAQRCYCSDETVARAIKALDVAGYIQLEDRPGTRSRYIYPQLKVMLLAAAAAQAKLPVTKDAERGEQRWQWSVEQHLRDQLERKLSHIRDLALARIRAADAADALIEHNKFRSASRVEQLYYALQDAHLLATRDSAARARRATAPVWTPELARQHADAHAAVFASNRNHNQPNQPGEVFV